MTMDLNALITWKSYEAEERRSDDRAKTLKDLVTTAREQLPQFIQALGAAFAGRSQATGAAQGGPGAAAGQPPHNSVQCKACGSNITLTPNVPAPDKFNCPNCGAEVTTK
jgi:hypothetical protein